MTTGRRIGDVAIRIRHDYFGRDRGAEYAALINEAVEAGYEIVSLADFHDRASRGVARDHPLLALRHDVDVRDPGGNEAFYATEKAAGASSSFYFRLSTARAHGALISRLLRDGFEVGYHFEEAATAAKRHHLRTRAELEPWRAMIDDLFRQNCSAFRDRWNSGLLSVSSHGDWINRRLGFINHEFVSAQLLEDCSLRFEAYGDDLLGRADVYVSDVATPPERWSGGRGLSDAVRAARHPIYMLAHEGRWHVNRRARASADLERVTDAFRYELLNRVGRRD